MKMVVACVLASSLAGLSASAEPANVEMRNIKAPTSAYERVVRAEVPEGCPFAESSAFAGVGFTRRHAEYTDADTWYPSWAADGNLYSPWTDGSVRADGAAKAISCGSGSGANAATGHATIVGDDPLHLRIVQAGTFKSSALPYRGRYPCGSLVVGGVWYYGTYCLHPSGYIKKNGIKYNWPWLGPFVGFRWSTDFGQSWHETPCTPVSRFLTARKRFEPCSIGVKSMSASVMAWCAAR